jgi:hypothetical protein
VLYSTAAEPEHVGEEEELDVFQPRRPPLPSRGYAGLFEAHWTESHTGRTVPVRPPANHARPRTGGTHRARRAALRRLSTQVRSASRSGLRSLGEVRAWRRDPVPEPRLPRTLAASAVLTVVVLLAFAVVRDSSAPDPEHENSAGLADQSATIPAMPGVASQTRPSLGGGMADKDKMQAISSRIPASAVRHQPSGHKSGHRDGHAAKPKSDASDGPSRTFRGGGSQSSESGPQYGSYSGARDRQLARWSVQSVNYPDRFWRVRSGAVFLDSVGDSSAARADAGFTVVKGLADSSCYSFIADNGSYLRHRDFRLILSSPDGSQLFRQDATFCRRSGAYDGTVSFESYNYPGRFLRHRNFELWLDPRDDSSLFAADSSFRVASALS